MSIDIKVSKRGISYKKAMLFLNKRVEEIKNNKNKELIWLLEHPLTFTAGIRYDNHDIFDKKIKIIKTNRGGKITLHSPGQKIIYFALNLNKRKKDIRKLINAIEVSIIQFLKIYKIKGISDKKNIGIWVNGKKIAAIGLRVSKWIAYHGFSLNINNDLNEYRKIKPCGLNNKKITSIYNEKKKPINIDEEKLVDILVRNVDKI
jgi:lipoyl(octanoyl) transferase